MSKLSAGVTVRLLNVLRLVMTPIAKPAGRKLTKPAGKTAARAFVPSRETMKRSTNCMTVKETVETTMGAESLSM